MSFLEIASCVEAPLRPPPSAGARFGDGAFADVGLAPSLIVGAGACLKRARRTGGERLAR